jgi:hypothetical protein
MLGRHGCSEPATLSCLRKTPSGAGELRTGTRSTGRSVGGYSAASRRLCSSSSISFANFTEVAGSNAPPISRRHSSSFLSSCSRSRCRSMTARFLVGKQWNDQIARVQRDRVTPGSCWPANHRASFPCRTDAAHGPQATTHSSFRRNHHRRHRPTWVRRTRLGPGRSCRRRSRAGLRPGDPRFHKLVAERRYRARIPVLPSTLTELRLRQKV